MAEWLSDLSQRLPLPTGERGTCFDLWRNSLLCEEESPSSEADGGEKVRGGGVIGRLQRRASFKKNEKAEGEAGKGLTSVGASSSSSSSASASPGGRQSQSGEKPPGGCVVL